MNLWPTLENNTIRTRNGFACNLVFSSSSIFFAFIAGIAVPDGGPLCFARANNALTLAESIRSVPAKLKSRKKSKNNIIKKLRKPLLSAHQIK